MPKRIIDVSEHQKKIDWEKVRPYIDGAIIRTGYGDDLESQDDKYAVRNMSECERLGIPYMTYLYSYADSDAHIRSEIAHEKRMTANHHPLARFLDLEERDNRYFWHEAAKQWMCAFPTGGAYSWQWCFEMHVTDLYCRKWICAYGHNDGQPDVGYKPTMECDGWQYTSRGRIPGIEGHVDISEWYTDFGTMESMPAASRQDVANKMLSWEGFSERNGKFKAIIDGFNAYLPTAVKAGCANYQVKYSDEWCATCASYAYIACGIGYLFPVECSCPRMVTLAKQMGIWQEADDYTPKIGEAVLYDWDDSGKGDNIGTPDHIGIVIAVDGNQITVTEGNCSEAVRPRVISVNSKCIRGFICPRFDDSTSEPTKTITAPVKEETETVSKYEISKTGVPSKVSKQWGLLRYAQKVTARRQPDESAAPCSFSPVSGLTRIDVCDYITTDKRWAYCCVGGKYGYILASSISAYLRVSGLPVETVAKQVWDNDFGTLDTRANALKTLGYDVGKVQAAVTAMAETAPADTVSPKIRVWPIWFFEEDEGQYGDCTAILEYGSSGSVAHCILIDCAKASASSVVIRKLKNAGVSKIDAVVISHGHGDHYSGLSNILKAIPADAIYLPDTTELAKYQKTYTSALKRQAAKIQHARFLKAGDSFTIGHIKCDCLYICPANKLSEHDSHHFVNNQSMALRFTLDGNWIFHSAGDLQNEGNNLLIKNVKNLNADIFKCQWHGDANACNEAICKAVKPKVAFSNYHHKERSGRGATRKRLEAVGATVARNAENGDIYIDCQGEIMKLTCSKGNLTKKWVKKRLSTEQ